MNRCLFRLDVMVIRSLSFSRSRMIILEDELEKLMVAKESEEVTCAGYQELRERLHLLQPHMQACSCCWEDMTAQVERMLRRVTHCPGQRSNSQPQTQNSGSELLYVLTFLI